MTPLWLFLMTHSRLNSCGSNAAWGAEYGHVVDREQCEQLAARLDLVRVRPDEFLTIARSDKDRRREANLWFYLVAICQSTRTLQGIIDGQWYRGWDYMAHAARRALRSDPERFTAQRLASTTPDELRALFFR
jgi:hypothetical protein